MGTCCVLDLYTYCKGKTCILKHTLNYNINLGTSYFCCSYSTNAKVLPDAVTYSPVAYHRSHTENANAKKKACLTTHAHTFFTDFVCLCLTSGRPKGVKEQDVYICDYRLDKSAHLFYKIHRNRYPVCTKPYAFNHFPKRLTPKRDFSVSRNWEFSVSV